MAYKYQTQYRRPRGTTNGNNSPVSVLSGWTNTSFEIQTNGSTSVNFIAIGPK